MGVSLFKPSKCSIDVDVPTRTAAKRAGNPDPKKFKILRHAGTRYATVVEVQYPDARNYEGRKIMVYRVPWETVRAQVELDPHFCDDGSHLSPFARFEPTNAGWAEAMQLVRVF